MEKFNMQLCECNCGGTPNPGKRYLWGHNCQGRQKGYISPFRGQTKETSERSRKISEKLKNNPKVIENGRKGGKSTKGIKRTNEFKLHLSKIQKGKSFEEEYGKKRALEISDKISKSHIKRMLLNPEHNARKYFKTGWFYSVKNNLNIFYRSSWELHAFCMLEQLSKVVSYCSSPYFIEYKINDRIHRYIPDILITYTTGEKEIIEIKPKSRIKQNEGHFNEKTEAARNFATVNNLKFSTWTEEELKLDGTL